MTMTPAFLVEECRITSNGEGKPLPVAPAAASIQITLGVTDASEQSSLDVSIYTSADGETWSPKPALIFPQRFYKGVAALLLNVEEASQVRFLRAQWKVSRWGRGSLKPEFGIYVFAGQVE